MIINEKRHNVTGSLAAAAVLVTQILTSSYRKSEIEPIVVRDNVGGFATFYIEKKHSASLGIHDFEALYGEDYSPRKYCLRCVKNGAEIGRVVMYLNGEKATLQFVDVNFGESGKGIAQLMLSIAMDFMTNNLDAKSIKLVVDSESLKEHVGYSPDVPEELFNQHEKDLIRLYKKFGFALRKEKPTEAANPDEPTPERVRMFYRPSKGYPSLESSTFGGRRVYHNPVKAEHRQI